MELVRRKLQQTHNKNLPAYSIKWQRYYRVRIYSVFCFFFTLFEDGPGGYKRCGRSRIHLSYILEFLLFIIYALNKKNLHTD